METTELLKKLKTIKPDSDYSRKSRMVVLSHGSTRSTGSGRAELTINAENRLPVFSFSFRQIATGVLHSGWSIAMTAIFLLLAIGSFSVLKILSPATTAVVDLTGLKAEAQAIDAQIELTNIEYATAVIENKTSTVSMVLPAANQKAKSKQMKSGLNAAGMESTSTPPTIDSVLEILSE